MATSTDLAAQIAAYDTTKKSSADILNAALASYGVPGIQQNVSDLRTTLNNTQKALSAVPDSVTGRTSGSLVTEAQRQAIVNNESAPLLQSISGVQGDLSTESENLADAQKAAQLLAQGQIDDWNTGRTNLEQEYQDAFSSEQAKAAAQAEAAKQAEAIREFNASQSSNGSGSSSQQYTWKKQAGGGYDVVDSNGKVVKVDLATAVASQGGDISNLVSLLANGSTSDKAAAKQYMKLMEQNKPTQAYNYLLQHTGAFYTGGGF